MAFFTIYYVMKIEKAIKRLEQKGTGFITSPEIFDKLKFPNSEEKINDLIKDYLSKNEIKISCFSDKKLKTFYLTYNYGYIELAETKYCEYENCQLYSFNDLSKKFGNSKINFGMSNNIKLSISEKNVSLF